MSKIEKDLNVIKKNAIINTDENFRFRSFLKGQDGSIIDPIVHELYEYVVKQIDCTECANCCIELETSFTIDEVDNLTQSLSLEKETFLKNNTHKDDYGTIWLNSRPCQFLKDKKCTIYDLRPEECNAYPYLHRDNFISRLISVIDNCEICPIVYNVYELLKERLGYR